MMKRVKASLFLASLVLSFGYVLTPARTPPDDPAQSKRGRGGSTRARVLSQGRELFISNCARCHGADGLGKTRLGETLETPDMTDRRWQSRRSDGRMRQSITNGRDEMPAFGGKLSKKEVAALVAYVRSLKK